jgi:hypothetical protein
MGQLVIGQVEQQVDVPFGDDERVPLGNRETVQHHGSKFAVHPDSHF